MLLSHSRAHLNFWMVQFVLDEPDWFIHTKTLMLNGFFFNLNDLNMHPHPSLITNHRVNAIKSNIK